MRATESILCLKRLRIVGVELPFRSTDPKVPGTSDEEPTNEETERDLAESGENRDKLSLDTVFIESGGGIWSFLCGVSAYADPDIKSKPSFSAFSGIVSI